jgi:hypothetical protein
LIAVYNGASVLGEALESVRSQDFVDYEVVVIDDCSTDGTSEVARSFGDLRLRIVRMPKNVGAAAARNVGLREARGQYVAVLDADDVMYPTRLSGQAALLNSNPRVALVCGQYDVVDESGARLRSEAPRGDVTTLTWCLMFGNLVAHSMAMYRRQLALAVGGYSEELDAAEDYALVAALAREHMVACLPIRVGAYRENPDGRTAQLADAPVRHAVEISRRGISLLLGRDVDAYVASTLCCTLAYNADPYMVERDRQRASHGVPQGTSESAVDAAAISMLMECMDKWLDRHSPECVCRGSLARCALDQAATIAKLSPGASSAALRAGVATAAHLAPATLVSMPAVRLLLYGVVEPLWSRLAVGRH